MDEQEWLEKNPSIRPFYEEACQNLINLESISSDLHRLHDRIDFLENNRKQRVAEIERTICLIAAILLVFIGVFGESLVERINLKSICNTEHLKNGK